MEDKNLEESLLKAIEVSSRAIKISTEALSAANFYRLICKIQSKCIYALAALNILLSGYILYRFCV